MTPSGHDVEGARAIPTGVPETGGGRRRLRSIDAFRGAVLAFMLVTPTGGEPDSYPLLRHAEWDGWTLSDLIFPTFLVTSGASLAFLLRPPVRPEVVLRLVRRIIALVVLGVLYNAFGGAADLSEIRVTGVLQLIGLSGGIAAGVVLLLRRRDGSDRRSALAAFALGAVALYGMGLGVLDGGCAVERCSPFHALDEAVLGSSHLYRGGSVDYDPEGIAVIGSASALVIAGYLAGQHLRAQGALRHTSALLGGAGASLVAAGLALGVVVPINKRLHTPSFSLLAAGVAVVGLALFTRLFDQPGTSSARRVERVRAVATYPFRALGRNALIVFLGERVLTVSAAQTPVGDGSLQDWLIDHWAPFSGATAHIGYGLLILAAVLAVTVVMDVMRWRVAL